MEAGRSGPSVELAVRITRALGVPSYRIFTVEEATTA
jgi:DNA-binding XRE family transcriptional regulator